MQKKFSPIYVMASVNFPPDEISKAPRFGKRNYEQIILWMLVNNDECQWADFTKEPLKFSTSTLSKYFNILRDKGYVDNYSRGHYKITSEGRKRYYEISRVQDEKFKLNYPPDVIKRKRNYDDWILWMLYNNNFCRWTDFLRPPLSINQSSLSKNINLLLEKEFIIREDKEYKITYSGKIAYSKMLQNYDLDKQSILDEEFKRIDEITKYTIDFFQKYNIKEQEIQFRFLNNVLNLDYARVKSMLTDKRDFEKILLFLSINHPNYYPQYISPEEFANVYEIKKSKLIYYIDEIVENNIYSIKFFKLKSTGNIYYYFQEGESLESLLRAITENHIKKATYLNRLYSKSIDLNTIQENILKDVCGNVFKIELKEPLRNFLPIYINYLAYKIETRVEFKESYDKLNAIIWQNMINIFQTRNIEDLEFEFVGQNKVNYKIDTSILEILLSFLKPKQDSLIKVLHYLIEMKEYYKGLETVESALKSTENKILPMILKAILLCYLNRNKDVIDFIEEEFKYSKKGEEDQNYPIISFLLVFSNISIGNFEKSQKYINNIIPKFSNHVLSYVAAGLSLGYNILYKFDKNTALYGDGLKELENAIKLDTSSLNKGLYLQLKSKIYLQLNNYELAILAIEEAIKLLPKRVELYNTKILILIYYNKYNQILELLDYMLELFINNEKELKLKKALTLKQLGNIKSGFEIIESLVEKYTEDYTLLNCKAYWYLYMNKKEEAFKEIQKAIKHEPENGLNYDTYGEILMYYEDYENAILQFQKAIKKSRFGLLVHEMYIKLGICYKELRNYEKALENLRIGKEYTEKCFCDYETKQKWLAIANLFLKEIEHFI